MTNPSPSTDTLAKTLAALEAERQRRLNAGQWSKGARPRLVVLPADGETLQAAQQREVYRYLAEHPDAPQAIAAYDWIHHTIIDPKPAVELPGEQFDQPDMVDMTPPQWGPPVSPPPSSARSLPPPPGSVDPRSVNIPARIHDAEHRRTRNFNDDTWGDPTGWPIRYPRGNRSGW